MPVFIALTDARGRQWLQTLGVVIKQIVFHPLIVSAYAGTIVAALHLRPPVAIDGTL